MYHVHPPTPWKIGGFMQHSQFFFFWLILQLWHIWCTLVLSFTPSWCLKSISTWPSYEIIIFICSKCWYTHASHICIPKKHCMQQFWLSFTGAARVDLSLHLCLDCLSVSITCEALLYGHIMDGSLLVVHCAYALWAFAPYAYAHEPLLLGHLFWRPLLSRHPLLRPVPSRPWHPCKLGKLSNMGSIYKHMDILGRFLIAAAACMT